MVYADVDKYIHCKSGHNQDVKGNHNISITNDTLLTKTYNITLMVCTYEMSRCKTDNFQITLSTNEHYENNYKTQIEHFCYSNDKIITTAITSVQSDGYWKAEKKGVIESKE